MKRLVLLCDGTWNEDDSSRPVTNIVRLRDLLAHSLDPRSSVVGPGRPTSASPA